MKNSHSSSGLAKNDGVLHVYINSFSYRRLRRDLLSNMVTLVCKLYKKIT